MIFIAHRGNTDGPCKEKENSPEYIQVALDKGFYVEVDIWVFNQSGKKVDIWLGHDLPEYIVEFDFLKSRKERLYCHAKNDNALFFLIKKKMRCFSHNVDPYTLVSDSTIWAFPGQKLNEDSICVMPEKTQDWLLENWMQCFGVCSDHVEELRTVLNRKIATKK